MKFYLLRGKFEEEAIIHWQWAGKDVSNEGEVE
jgi:hypothetical protein